MAVTSTTQQHTTTPASVADRGRYSLNVRLSLPLAARLYEMADERGSTVSAVARSLLAEAVRHREVERRG